MLLKFNEHQKISKPNEKKLGMNDKLPSGKYIGRTIKTVLNLSSANQSTSDYLAWMYDTKKLEFDDYVLKIINRK